MTAIATTATTTPPVTLSWHDQCESNFHDEEDYDHQHDHKDHLHQGHQNGNNHDGQHKGRH